MSLTLGPALVPKPCLFPLTSINRFRFVTRFWLLGLVVLSSACATLDRSECEAGQWQNIGYYDGARGRGVEFLGLHERACSKHGVSVDPSVYAQGYQVGLADYCQPDTAVLMARNEEIYNYICPVEFEQDFLTAYRETLVYTLQELKSDELLLEDRYYYARWRHPTYITTHEVAAPASAVQANGGDIGNHRYFSLVPAPILGALSDKIGDYRDRRIRLRNALARAERVLEAKYSPVPVSDPQADPQAVPVADPQAATNVPEAS